MRPPQHSMPTLPTLETQIVKQQSCFNLRRLLFGVLVFSSEHRVLILHSPAQSSFDLGA